MNPFGIRFSPMRLHELARFLAEVEIEPGQGARNVITPNLEHIVHMSRDARLADAYRTSWIAIADGVPVYLYARLRGGDVPERVAGSTLFAELMPLLDPTRHRCFFVCPSDKVTDSLGRYLRSRGFDDEALAFLVPPMGFDTDPAKSAELAARIVAHRPTHLFIGVSSVRSEIWLHQYRHLLGDHIVLCIGAGMEFFTGDKSRAPRAVQKAGLEWFWRFAQEPRRLFRRYFVESWIFLAAVRKDLRDRG